MKKFILVFLLLASVKMLHAQKTYFVYMQTEAPTPFFVKIGDRISSSTSQGYIILSSLRDSTYTFSIGGPQMTETKFVVPVQSKDRGFLLKDFNGTYGLFDLQSMEVIHAVPAEKKPEPLAYRTDEFSKKLAQSVDDPSLLFVFAKAEPVVAAPVLAKNEEKIEPTAPVTSDVSQTIAATDDVEKKGKR